MLDQLDDKQVRALRNFFAAENIPFTEENLQKYGTGDVLKNIMKYYGEETGLGAEQAGKELDDIRSSVRGATSKFKKGAPLTEDEILTPEQKKDEAARLEQDSFEKGQMENYFPSGYPKKTEDALNAFASEKADANEEPLNPDTFETSEIKPAVGSTEYPEIIIDEEKPAKGEQLRIEETPWVVENKKDGVENLKKEYETLDKELQGKQKPKTTQDFSGTEVFGDIKDAQKQPTVKGEAPSVLDTVEENKATLTPTTVTRGVEITNKGVGPVPAVQSRTGEKVPDVEETATVAFGDKAKNPYAAFKPIVEAQKARLIADAKLKKGDPNKMTEDERNYLAASIPLAESLINADQPQLRDMQRKADEEVKSKFISPEQQKNLDALTDVMKSLAVDLAGPRKPGEPDERLENLYDQEFVTKARKFPVERKYREALSAIDRKKMNDYIAKGLGQIASGLVGQYGFSRAIPVAQHFKYDRRDYTPEMQEAAKNYRTELAGINNQLAAIQKAMASGKGSPEDMTKRLTAVSTAMRALVDQAKLSAGEHKMGVGTTENYDGIRAILQPIYDTIEKLVLQNKELEARKWIATHKKVPTTSIDLSTTTGGKAKTGEQTALSSRDIERLQAVMVRLDDVTPSILGSASSQEKMKLLMDELRTFGVTENDIISALGQPSEWGTDDGIFKTNVRDFLYNHMRGLRRRSQSGYEKSTTNKQKGVNAPLPEEPAGIKEGREQFKKPEAQGSPAPTAKPTETAPTTQGQYPEGHTFKPVRFHNVMVIPKIKNGKVAIPWNGEIKYFELDSPEAKQLMGQ